MVSSPWMHPNSQRSIHVVIAVAFRKTPYCHRWSLNILSMWKREERQKNIDFFWVAIQHHLPYYLHRKEKRTNTLYGQVDHHTCIEFEAKFELLLKVHVLLRQHRCKNSYKPNITQKIHATSEMYGASNKYYAIVPQTSMSNLHESPHCLIFHK